PFVLLPAVIIEHIKRLVELEPVPDNAAIDALWPWHPAIIDHLVKFCHANTDILGGLDARETARGKRERQSTDCPLSHCAAPAISRRYCRGGAPRRLCSVIGCRLSSRRRRLPRLKRPLPDVLSGSARRRRLPRSPPDCARGGQAEDRQAEHITVRMSSSS